MFKANKNIFALLLLSLILLPSVVKLEHHTHHVCKDKETHFHPLHENCNICHFEFSLFYSDFNPFQKNRTFYFAEYLITYSQKHYFCAFFYKLFLRSPPEKFCI